MLRNFTSISMANTNYIDYHIVSLKSLYFSKNKLKSHPKSQISILSFVSIFFRSLLNVKFYLSNIYNIDIFANSNVIHRNTSYYVIHRNFSRKIYHRIISEKDLRITALTDTIGTALESYISACIAVYLGIRYIRDFSQNC